MKSVRDQTVVVAVHERLSGSRDIRRTDFFLPGTWH